MHTELCRVLEEGIVETKVSYREKTGMFSFDPEKSSPEKITEFINATGQYRVAGEIPEEQGEGPELFDIIIIGGGYIALEIAQAWQRLGTKVTLLQRSSHVLSKQTADVAEEIMRHLRNEGVEIFTGLTFQQVEEQEGKVVVRTLQNKNELTFSAEQLLVSTGIRPNTSDLGAEKIGLRLSGSGHVEVNEHLQSNISHIYAAGDCIATPAYVYTAAYEGKLSDVPRSLAAFDTRDFVKLIRNPGTDRLLGARIIVHEGSELTIELSLAIKYGIPVKKLASSFHAYLTLSEAVKLAAIGFEKEVKTLSCCAV